MVVSVINAPICSHCLWNYQTDILHISKTHYYNITMPHPTSLFQSYSLSYRHFVSRKSHFFVNHSMTSFTADPLALYFSPTPCIKTRSVALDYSINRHCSRLFILSGAPTFRIRVRRAFRGSQYHISLIWSIRIVRDTGLSHPVYFLPSTSHVCILRL